MKRWLWRFDWDPDQRALVECEAAALETGESVAPGLVVGKTPFEPGRAAFAVGGGELLADGPAGEPLDLPEGTTKVHVPKGPWKASGNPVDFLARLGDGLEPAPRGAPIELYAAEERWFLVRAPEEPAHFRVPTLPIRTSTTLSSQMARAVVNLVARPGDRVLDPVCGTGVLLVEAARIGARVEGWDTNKKACYSAKLNLDALQIKGEVNHRDALTGGEDQRFDALVGDLPYGVRLEPATLEPFVQVLPGLARRWALVANVDLTETIKQAGFPHRYTVEVPKTTFSRFVMVGGEPV